MTAALLERQACLPQAIQLLRYAPDRMRFDWQGWDPAAVRSAADLPPYLVLGPLDPSTFAIDGQGWSVRWQGTEAGTYLEVAYQAGQRRWGIRKAWCGLDGGLSFFPSHLALEKVLGQVLGVQFSGNWDRAAKERFEAHYQIKFVEHQKEALGFFGIPDGDFRSIAFPVPVLDLRRMRHWLRDRLAALAPPYPVWVQAKRVFQVVNYLEGLAPSWTAQEVPAFMQSIDDTGLVPQGFPVREVAPDGSAAWTLRRDAYFVFIGVPFAGITDLLAGLASPVGPIRRADDPPLRFELQPMLLPVTFEFQFTNAALWDRERTTRSFLEFSPANGEVEIPSVAQFIASEREADHMLVQAEEVGEAVAATIEELVQQSTDGRTA